MRHRRVFRPWFLSLAILGVSGPLIGQQIVDATEERFPVQPLEWTNQATLGDLDGDGDLDIFFANGGEFSTPGPPLVARVYINNGNGYFNDHSITRTGNLAGLHRGVELGDCDNDGDLDVILVQDFERLPHLLINDGEGFFASEGETRLPQIELSSSRGQFGDVDNDGDMDLFFTTGSATRFGCGQYRLYLNDGSCFYTDATETHVPQILLCSNMDIIFGDIDNDFDIDIRTASTGPGNSRLYVNDGTGVFSAMAAPPDASCYSYDFGDIDGDGDLDLLGINGLTTSAGELMLDNDGRGNYSDVSTQIVPNPSQDDNDSKFFDFDNDGDLDLIVASLSAPGEKTYVNDGNGLFAQTNAVMEQIADSTLDVVVGDVNGDGTLDVVTAQGESGNYLNRLYINNGPADTIPPTIVDTEVPATPGSSPTVIRTLILDQMSSDRNFFDEGIRLEYTVNSGPVQSTSMRYSGGQVYRGVIPAQPAAAVVEYWVKAIDHNGNIGTGSTRSYAVPDCVALANCSGNGACIDGQCECHGGWDGLDCSILVPFPASAVPDGAVGADDPLRVRRLSSGGLRLTWDSSCGINDVDYAIYQGTIGDFTSHVPVVCSTGGALSSVLVADPGPLYWLVVPTSENAEGSYGRDSQNAQRPPGAGACAPQAIGGCLR